LGGLNEWGLIKERGEVPREWDDASKETPPWISRKDLFAQESHRIRRRKKKTDLLEGEERLGSRCWLRGSSC